MEPNVPDPFSPENLRLSQDFAETGGVRKLLTVVPCRKPKRQEFVRVRPGEDWRLTTAILEDDASKDAYLVDASLHAALADEIKPVCLRLAVTSRKDVLLWPIRLPGADGRSNTWNDSAAVAADVAESKWVRVVSNMPGGCYDCFTATAALGDPQWPEEDFRELLRRCFKDRFIRDEDHPLLRQLRGEQ